MIFKLTLLNILFLAFATLVVPPSQPGARLARGEDIPSQPSNSPAPSVHVLSANPTNPDWAGAQCGGLDWEAIFVTVTIVVPKITLHNDDPSETVARFLAVLGDPGPSAINSLVHVGIQIRVTNKVAKYSGVYGWALGNAHEFTGPAVGVMIPGDQIKVTAFTAAGHVGGIVVIQNMSQDWVDWALTPFYIQGTSTVGWLVVGDKIMRPDNQEPVYVGFPDFGTVIFYDATCTLSAFNDTRKIKHCVPPEATLTSIVRSGELPLATPWVTGPASFVVKYRD